jgi:DnaJ-class molecular chaperone
MINYYRVLGAKDFAAEADIKTAYRKLSKKFHPDVNDGDPFFEEKFKELQNAYENLIDASLRSIHDTKLRNQNSGGGASHGHQQKQSKSTHTGQTNSQQHGQRSQTNNTNNKQQEQQRQQSQAENARAEQEARPATHDSGACDKYHRGDSGKVRSASTCENIF